MLAELADNDQPPSPTLPSTPESGQQSKQRGSASRPRGCFSSEWTHSRAVASIIITHNVCALTGRLHLTRMKVIQTDPVRSAQRPFGCVCTRRDIVVETTVNLRLTDRTESDRKGCIASSPSSEPVSSRIPRHWHWYGDSAQTSWMER